tara:strand:+ start:6800 stop:7561 length:762 start_codon:yes stop_codon:yes gene_type:complete
MKLNYKELGIGRPLLILHGLFGFSDNWQSQAKKLSNYYRVFLIDLRNHGRSPWSDDFSYTIMANDIFELCKDLNLNEIILLGHSMGGKVAMNFAQNYSELIKKLIIVDIGIKKYNMRHSHILSAINSIDLHKISNRREVGEIMNPYLESESVKQFLLKNLYWESKGKLAWRMNVKVLEREMDNILSAIDNIIVNVPTLFIRGSESDYILDSDIKSIEELFIDSEIEVIHKSGHWVHAESPENFYKSVLSFCLR